MRRTIGKYQIKKEIGNGSAAKIYLASQPSLNRMVAIKELRRHYANNSKLTSRFEREAKVVSNMRHDGIVHIYDFWKQRNSCYIVMEYIQGITLKEILKEKGKLPLDVALVIIYQVAAALEYAHSLGIVHRDIKPGNVMVTSQGVVKLLDFGIATHIDGASDLTAEGSIIGTYAYMSPEQASGKRVDHRSDIFSLGTMIYEILSGLKPFRGNSNEGVLEAIVRKSPTAIRKIDRDIPRGMWRIIRKCLRKDKKRRYKTAGEIRKGLERPIKKLNPDRNHILREFIIPMLPPDDHDTAFGTAGIQSLNLDNKQNKVRGLIFVLSRTLLFLSPIFIVESVLHYFGFSFLVQFEWFVGLYKTIDVYFLRFILLLGELF